MNFRVEISRIDASVSNATVKTNARVASASWVSARTKLRPFKIWTIPAPWLRMLNVENALD